MDLSTLIRLIADGAVLPVILLATFALLVYVPKGKRLESYSRVLVAGLTAYLLAKLLGAVYQPTEMRPFELLGVTAGASYLNNPGFPSDHALFTAFLTLAVWFETGRKKLSIVLAVLTLLVCTGRILALVHTPLDVIGGVMVACIGSLWFLEDYRKTAAVRQKAKKAI